MLPSQGLRPLDPYRTLQLHPHAPRGLIIEAYWALIARQRHGTAPQAIQAIDDLNDAYGLLIDDKRRRAYDEESGVAGLHTPQVRATRRGFGLLGFGSSVTLVSDHSDYYHLLRIDRDAAPEIVDLAHAIMSRQTRGGSVESVFLAGLLDQAHRTLRNPQRRAQYDAALLTGKRDGRTGPPPLVTPAAMPHLDLPTPDARDTIIAEVMPLDECDVVIVQPSPPRESSPDIGAPDESTVPEMYASAPLPESPAEEAADAAIDAEAGPDEDALPAIAAAPSESPTRPAGMLLRMMRMGQRPATPPSAKPVPEPAGETAAPASASVSEKKPAAPTMDAGDARVLSLRDSERPVPMEYRRPVRDGRDVEPRPRQAVDAELAFIAGPHAGARVALNDHAVTLGTSYDSDIVLDDQDGRIAPEHARIWRHGEHFVFRQVDGRGTVIGGSPMTLPLVMLEDGDEIEIGGHRLRFEHRSPGS